MQKITPITTNFTSGELSTTMEGRVDLQQYFNGCRKLENAIVLTHGGAEKRPGTYFVAEAKDSSTETRLVPFKFSTTQEYVLEFGVNYIRFYKDTGQIQVAYAAWLTITAYVIGNLVTNGGNYYRCLVAHTSGTFATDLAAGKWVVSGGASDLAYEIVTTYAESELFDLKFEQSADTLYIAHPSHAPAKLTRSSHTSWTLADISFSGTSPFVGANNYPACVAFFEQRLCWAGTNANPQTEWLSTSGSYEDFAGGTAADDSMSYTINASGVNRIRWMVSENFLLLGTTEGFWRFGGASANDPITPSSVQAKKQSGEGSADIQGLLLGDSIIFPQYYGRKIFAAGYSFEKDKYTPDDLTKLARHITGDGIVDWAYQQAPDPIVWMVRSDGELVSMTFYLSEKVIAFSRHITDGLFESVAIVHGTTEDRIWGIVNRTIGGETKRYVEYFMPRDFGDKEDAFFVDSGLTFDGGTDVVITGATKTSPVVVSYTGSDPTNGWTVYIEDVVGMTELNGENFTVANVNAGANTFELSGVDGTAYTDYDSGGVFRRVANSVSGLDHLEGETVRVCVDGAAHADCDVASGGITLDAYYNTIHAGMAYDYKVKPMRYESNTAGGSSAGVMKRIEKVTVRFANTIGCKAGPDEDNLEDIIFGNNAELYNGDKEIDLKADYDTDGDIVFVHDQPLPITITAIMPNMAIYER